MTTTLIARNRKRTGNKPAARAENGFSLLELVIAMAIFLIVSGMSFSLFNQQQASSKLMQGQTGLNMALRNAVAQLQMDMVGAGSGVFQGANIPAWPVGVTIVNHVVGTGSTCYYTLPNESSSSYTSSCFDQINIITAANQTTYPRIYATGTSANNFCSVTSQGVAYGQAAVVNGTAWSLAASAAEFKNGDQLLFEKNDGTMITSVVLTADASVSNGMVKFTFQPTLTATDNSTNPPSVYKGYSNLTYDPLDITACDNTDPCMAGRQPQVGPPAVAGGGLGEQFCSTDWIIKLAPIQYFVCSGPGSNTTWCTDTSATSPDIQNPKLMRVQSGAKSVVMEQVIGFKVGAVIINPSNQQAADNDSVTVAYNYDASSYRQPWNFTLVRSVRISLIGRTSPSNSDSEFRNSFDNGRYQVQGVAVVVNPRNSSMND
jgi:prepilin-type N-terminal cleavage/methylation domain-containing protein